MLPNKVYKYKITKRVKQKPNSGSSTDYINPTCPKSRIWPSSLLREYWLSDKNNFYLTGFLRHFKVKTTKVANCLWSWFWLCRSSLSKAVSFSCLQRYITEWLNLSVPIKRLKSETDRLCLVTIKSLRNKSPPPYFCIFKNPNSSHLTPPEYFNAVLCSSDEMEPNANVLPALNWFKRRDEYLQILFHSVPFLVFVSSCC